MEPLKKLYDRWQGQVQFLDVIVRQAHPGPGAPAYESLEQKLEDARDYQHREAIPWAVTADDLDGSHHKTYGGLADPTYLIGADGRVSFYNMWTYAPSLNEALKELIANGGSGVVHGGIDRTPYLAPAMVHGWPGLEMGLPQSVIDMETAFPGTAVGSWFGYQLRPVLGGMTSRIEPLPTPLKVGLAAGAVALVAFGVARAVQRSR
ncbi:MAG: hypothetical protein ACO1SX_26965 [Actinomycetota bacterium]